MASHDFNTLVKKRDNYECVKCGYSPTNKSSLHAHHINPKDNGGPDIPENGVTLCYRCHKFAPDWNTIIHNDSYADAFEIYRSTMNPPVMDVFMFGMMAEKSEETSGSDIRQSTMFQQVPNLDPSNWWIVTAAFADYKKARSLIPMKWDWSTEQPMQTELYSL